jgi:hypothetical protein
MGLAIFGTSNYTDPYWAPNPTTRGTTGLVLGCLVTLVLCVYSALHLNVFHRQCPWWMRCLVRTKWMLIALLAPEFVVFNAWSQRRHALRIAQVLRRRSGQAEPESIMMRLRRQFGTKKAQEPDRETDPKASSNSQTFDISHGFLIVMGGLVVDMSRDPDRVWPTWCDSLTVTPACVEQCFGRGLFDDVDLSFLSKESIAGRSKSDYFTKLITSVQALWFCAQFFVRLGESLPVSLLELNTFAHSICALTTYCLWWRKPGEIEDPFVLHTDQSDALRDLCAAQWTLGASGKHYKKQSLHRYSANAVSDEEKATLRTKWEPMTTHGGSEFFITMFRGRSGLTLLPGAGEDWYIFQNTDETRWFYFPRYQGDDSQLPLKMRPADARSPVAMQLAAGQRIPGTREHVAPQFRCVEVDGITLARWARALHAAAFLRENYSIWLRDRQPNFVWPRGLDSAEDGAAIADELVKALATFLATSLGYGGLHMLAWESGALRGAGGSEETLWKLACLTLVVLGPAAFVGWAGLRMWRGPDAHLRFGRAWSVVLGFVAGVAVVVYAVARVYLVVEVFVVLPYMDPEVYKLPEYAVYWPHVG